MLFLKRYINILIPSCMALAMIAIFCYGSQGWSLIVTFVPAVPLALWLYYKTCYQKCPPPEKVLVLYFIGIGCQLLHFAEEHAYGFDCLFGPLFGGSAYDHNTFVTFNMVAYFLFIIGGLAFYKGIKPLMFLAMFFICYGMVGNAIGHFLFCIKVGGYFPGAYSSVLNIFLSVPLIYNLWKSTR
jgi:hypothetical protein